MKKKMNINRNMCSPDFKRDIMGTKKNMEIELDNYQTIEAKPFNDLVIMYKPYLVEKATWMKTMTTLEKELIEIYQNENLVGVFMSIILDQMDEVMGSKRLGDYKNKHAKVVLTKAINKVIENTGNGTELKVGVLKQ